MPLVRLRTQRFHIAAVLPEGKISGTWQALLFTAGSTAGNAMPAGSSSRVFFSWKAGGAGIHPVADLAHGHPARLLLCHRGIKCMQFQKRPVFSEGKTAL